jgi:hypothetical protein
MLRVDLQEVRRRLLRRYLACIQATNGIAAPGYERLTGARAVFRSAKEVVTQMVAELRVTERITALPGPADEKALNRFQAVPRDDPLGAQESADEVDEVCELERPERARQYGQDRFDRLLVEGGAVAEIDPALLCKPVVEIGAKARLAPAQVLRPQAGGLVAILPEILDVEP